MALISPSSQARLSLGLPYRSRHPNWYAATAVSLGSIYPCNARLDDFAKSWPQDPTYWWERWGPENAFSTSDTSLGGAFTTWEMPEPREPGLSAAVFDPSQVLEFCHGDTRTYYFIFGRSDLDIEPHHKYILKMRPQDFAAWDYGAEIDLLRTHRSPADSCKNGPILFEPVNAMAWSSRESSKENAQCLSFSYRWSYERKSTDT